MTEGSDNKFVFDLRAAMKKHSVFTEEKIPYQCDELLHIIAESKKLFEQEPMLLEVPLPVVIVGDIHGQYADLQRIFTVVGEKGQSGIRKNRFVFLGDYVDRGNFSLECITCLLVYKMAFPRMFNMLRGNHEFSIINQTYGFFTELNSRFPSKEASTLYNAFNNMFDNLPLAALVNDRILCMHGGYGESLKSFDDIRNIKRPLKDPNSNPVAVDLLWADPMVDLKGYVPNNMRGISVFFGEDTVLELCTRLKVDLIVRAHQMMLNGYGFFCKRKLVTLFSAPRYYPEKNNKGAVMLVDKKLHVSFRLLAPVTRSSMGKQKFCEEFKRMEKEGSYVTRQQAIVGTAESVAQSSTRTATPSVTK